jgi:tetratricopeptide (TPR) repeat protein
MIRSNHSAFAFHGLLYRVARTVMSKRTFSRSERDRRPEISKSISESSSARIVKYFATVWITIAASGLATTGWSVRSAAWAIESPPGANRQSVSKPADNGGNPKEGGDEKSVAAAPPPATRSLPRDSDVPALIQQLGHPSFAARVRARESLERLGLQAFDDLHAAQYHADSEIAMTARYLVSSLLVSWSTESDPQAVREALDEYGAKSESERQNRMDRLAELPDRQGLAALTRLARFETSLRLSREAALAIMRAPMSDDPAIRSAEADMIQNALGANNRQAAQWLRVYAEDLRQGDFNADAWRSLIAEQRVAVDAGADITTSRPAVLELVRVCATRAAGAGQRVNALEIAGAHLDLIPPKSGELIDACSWAIDNRLHPIVLKIKSLHPDLFARHPILLYGAAEATLAGGDGGDANAGDVPPDSPVAQAAEKLAMQASAIDPLPLHGSEQAAKLSPKAIEEIAQRHRETGRELESRGLFRWAEREYRHIIDSLPIDAAITANARAHLALMLGELQRHQDVVDVLEPMIRRSEEDQTFARRLQTLYVDVSRLKSTMIYHQGLAKAAGDSPESKQQARELLSAALELEPNNVDVLIAMYRVEGDEEWRNGIRRRIQSIALMIDNQIEAIRMQTQGRVRVPDLAPTLAEAYNQYAWLISNTEGDKQKALQYSLRSLELVPDAPPQLDTLGRCYFAVGDLSSAVRAQRRAVKLAPHSPPLRRQLAEFEAAAAAQSGSS